MTSERPHPDPRVPGDSDPVDAAADDAALLAALRRTWQHVDPVPTGFVDDMVAAVASADLGREYALLTLVESDATSAVRGDADMLTMQFSDGQTSVLVHITPAEQGTRRLDGWVDGEAAEVRLLQEGDVREATADGGRFSFDDLAPGIARLRVLLAAPPVDGGSTEMLTPRFEI